jgi:hypothetical protein
VDRTLSRETLPNRKVAIVRPECGLARFARGLSAAFEGRNDHRLAATAASLELVAVIVPLGFLVPLAFAADVRLVGLDEPAQEPRIVLHHGADTVSKKPRRLLANAKMARQCDAGQPLAGYSKQIQRREPRPQRQVCAFEWRSKSGCKFGVAGFALVVVLSPASERQADVSAPRANRASRPAHPFEVLPTCVIIRKLFEKSENRHTQRYEGVTTNVNRTENVLHGARFPGSR